PVRPHVIQKAGDMSMGWPATTRHGRRCGTGGRVISSVDHPSDLSNSWFSITHQQRAPGPSEWSDIAEIARILAAWPTRRKVTVPPPVHETFLPECLSPVSSAFPQNLGRIQNRPC